MDTINSIKINNSPEPVFETDQQSTYFLSVLEAREQIVGSTERVPFTNLEKLSSFLNTLHDQASDQTKPINDKGLGTLIPWNDQARDQAVQIIQSNYLE
ncbi:hypothetical protein [Flavobacterium piscisymbiosum]|uniref:Uncharacterized protein n=1 Tax=Flavobacterium piscisymbiosum TaxID=2893753 RepID=A0ABS8MDQ8_9FLAO|nr:hypothetical protein [Flavobacterium sp. F-30]MCC9063627.1 hypothetical protein [Flavobacterium sp. F-30]